MGRTRERIRGSSIRGKKRENEGRRVVYIGC